MHKFTLRNVFAGLCFVLLVPLSAFADVVINETNFPDANFRKYLLAQDYGKDGVITDAEMAKITRIDVANAYFTSAEEKIYTLEGIQYFTALEYLRCDYNQLTNLDVYRNTALTFLWCSANQLTSLDVSSNTALTFLLCYDNQIKGTNMDALISGLPSTNGEIYIDDSDSGIEGNVCTKTQVAAIKEKGWTPYYHYDYYWLEYEGADDTTGISGAEVGNGSEIDANAPAYDLNGKRVEDWQNRKGIYIVNGKKVMVK